MESQPSDITQLLLGRALKGLGMLDTEASTKIAISKLPGGAEAEPECAKLIRDMLCGETLPEMPTMPKLTVIEGGKREE